MKNTASISKRILQLERRFQPVTVNEPTIDETVEVLNGIASTTSPIIGYTFLRK
ncbi:MAG: hypothetical protein ACLT3Y_07285 [Ruminococcus callidus]